MSASYYGIFHFVLAAAADEFVGKTHRPSPRYVLVYRSIGHRAFRDLCSDAQKQIPPAKLIAYMPKGGFGQNIQAFAVVAVDMEEKRHQADYDPESRFTQWDAELAITSSTDAVHRFKQAGAEERKAFLTLLVCPPR